MTLIMPLSTVKYDTKRVSWRVGCDLKYIARVHYIAACQAGLVVPAYRTASSSYSVSLFLSFISFENKGFMLTLSTFLKRVFKVLV